MEKKKLHARKWKSIGKGVIFLKFLQMSFISRDTVNIFSNIHGKGCQDYPNLWNSITFGILMKELKALIGE